MGLGAPPRPRPEHGHHRPGKRPFAALAADRGFAATFENPPDIGGRYSALSYFGLVPALLAGADVAGLPASAAGMSDRLRASAAANPAARLAAAMAAGVRNGRDKVTIVAPEGQATFGLWLEQLLAESTGKDGTGVVPVVGEPLAGPKRPTGPTACSWRWATTPPRPSCRRWPTPATRSSCSRSAASSWTWGRRCCCGRWPPR